MMWFMIIIFFHIMGILSIINAVMTTRTSQGAIAWIIFLITFPYIAVPAYWILGRSRFHGYHVPRHSSDATIKKKLESVFKQIRPYRVPLSELTIAAIAAEKLAVLPVLRGNNVQLLIDGKATFDSILEGIEHAKKYILFQFFIIHNDDIGNKIKEQLIKKARQGLKVCFLYDEIGSHDLPDSYKNELKNAGVYVYDFHTQKGFRNRFQINFRNHRKVIIVDGQFAWLGGHNVGDDYLGKNPKFGHWRDTHIKIEGPAVLTVQISFLEDWYWATDQFITEINWLAIPAKNKDLNVLIVPSGPADELETATLMFHHAINSAQNRIWIASPYFVPDDAILSALQLAGLRGVDVRILIPDMPDHLLVYLAAFSYFEDASLTGIRFFRYTNGFLHQKVMLIDDHTATVGTANFDNRSFRLNFEITCVISDNQFSSEIEAMFHNDFNHAYEMTQNDMKNKSFWFKLSTRLARLTSPIQ